MIWKGCGIIRTKTGVHYDLWRLPFNRVSLRFCLFGYCDRTAVMRGNSQGTYYSTPTNTMRAYDALPQPVREALSNAAFSWAVQPFVTALHKGHSVDELVRVIARNDAKKILNDKEKVWGMAVDLADLGL